MILKLKNCLNQVLSQSLKALDANVPKTKVQIRISFKTALDSVGTMVQMFKLSGIIKRPSWGLFMDRVDVSYNRLPSQNEAPSERRIRPTKMNILDLRAVTSVCHSFTRVVLFTLHSVASVHLQTFLQKLPLL